MDLVHAYAQARTDIPVSIERDLGGDFIVRGERAVAPDILIDSRRPSDDTDDAMIPGDGIRQEAGRFQAVRERRVREDDGFEL